MKEKGCDMNLEDAKKHHKKHGDMDGKTCLLSDCPIHYPANRKVTGLLTGRPGEDGRYALCLECGHIAMGKRWDMYKPCAKCAKG